MSHPGRAHIPFVPVARAPDWTEWVEWVRTSLSPKERSELLSTFTPEQAEYLAKEDYVWVRGVGVVWMSSDHTLQRLRFTHGAYFRTSRGSFYIDSEGSTRIVHPNRPDVRRGSDPPSRQTPAASSIDVPPCATSVLVAR